MATPTPDPKNLKEVNKELGFIEDALTNISVLLTSKIEEAFENIGDSTKTIADIYANNLEKSIKGMAKNSDAILKNTMSALSGELKVKDVKKLQEKLELQQLATKRNIEKLKALGLVSDAEANRLQADLVDNYQIQKALLEDQLDIAKKQDNIFKDIGNEFKNKINKEAFTTLGILKFIIDAALKANTQTVALGKSLGRDSYAYRENLADVARSSDNINVSTTNLVEAYTEIAEATGLAYEFNQDQLETQIILTKQVGLQADEAAQIQRLAVLNGKTSEETYKSFVKGLTATRNQLKVGINFKAALAEAAKISGQLAANLGYNPERIAKAVVTAKAFGMTLDQVAKSGESLLNFESSIENELKAELLTGRQLNFERARAAALAGDQVTLAEELANQVGTSADFTKMNVLQQKSLAEAVGMTTDELANTLRKREEAIASGKSLAQITEEEAQQALERQNIQDKFNAAILKLQDSLGNLLAGPLGTLLDGFANLASHAWAVNAAMIAIGAISFARTIGSLATMAATLAASSVAGTTLASALTLGLGAAAIIAGVVAVAGMMSSATDEATSKTQNIKDGIAPAGNGPFTITDGFGRTAVTATGDGLAVSPNINRGGGEAGIIAAIERLASRPAVAYINGREAFANSLGSTSALGTSQMQNTSYRLA